MSVQRYRSVADMPAPERKARADGYEHVRALWRFSSRLVPPLFSPGVYKYRSIEDSQAARETATVDRMRRMRATRTGA